LIGVSMFASAATSVAFVPTAGGDRVNSSGSGITITGQQVITTLFVSDGVNNWVQVAGDTVTGGGGGSMAIGGAITGATAGSILFAGAGGVLAQDNANLVWDATNLNLRVGASAVSNAFVLFPLTVSVSSTDIVAYMWNTNAAGYSAIGFLDNALTYRCIVGYGNSGVPGELAGHAFIDTNGVDLVVLDGSSGHTEFKFGMTDGATFLEMADGAAAAVSAPNHARLIYNNGASQWQQSINGGAYAPFSGGGSGSSLLKFSGPATGGSTSTGTTYLADGTSSPSAIGYPVSAARTITRLSAHVPGILIGNAATVTLMKNGVATALTLTWLFTDPAVANITGSVAYAVDDLLDLQLTVGGVGFTQTINALAVIE
jgi:hypothetical protein